MYEITGLVNFYYNYGDWVPPPPETQTNQHLISSFAFLNDVNTFINLATIIGNTNDSAVYQQYYNSLANEFHTTFYNPSIGYADGKQTANVLALSLPGVVPSGELANVEMLLLNDIKNHQNHLSTGIIGTRYLFPVLSALQQTSLAVTLITQPTYPSYAWMFMNPYENATTLWELWDAPMEGPGMNSRNHIMFGSVGAWLYSDLAGILPNGLGEIIIKPQMSSFLSGVTAQYHTLKGTIVVEWKTITVDSGLAFSLSVSVPHNAMASLHIPCLAPPCRQLLEGDQIIYDSQPQQKGVGIHQVTTGNQEWVVVVGSGSFAFSLM